MRAHMHTSTHTLVNKLRHTLTHVLVREACTFIRTRAHMHTYVVHACTRAGMRAHACMLLAQTNLHGIAWRREHPGAKFRTNTTERQILYGTTESCIESGGLSHERRGRWLCSGY